MQITRIDTTGANELDKAELLKRFHTGNQDLVGAGTEAEVYACGDEQVLKVYFGVQRLSHFTTLQQFYSTINESDCGFRLPRIRQIVTVGNAIGVIEDRIAGISLDKVLPTMPGVELDRAEELYFSTVDALARIKILRDPIGFLLFDETERSLVASQTWSDFYAGLLREKLNKKTGDLIAHEVRDFETKRQRLLDCLSNDQEIRLSVVHGDFFPGNVMVLPDLSKVTGIIDFGSFTLFGDHVLDVAAAFGYYKMYESDRIAIRARVLPKALTILNTADHGKFYRYLAANAVLTCDLYITEDDPRENGHFRWAVEILNDEDYWQRMA